MTNIEQLYCRDVFSKLACTKEGSVQKISFLNFLRKNMECFFGGINYTDQKLVAFHALKFLQNAETNVLQSQMDKIVQIAKKAALLPQDPTVQPKNVDELTQKIASHILPKYQLPPPISFPELSYLYGKKLESLQLLERVKTEGSQEDFIIKPVSWNWKRIALVSLLALAAIPASIVFYNIYHPDPIASLSMDRLHDMPQELYEYLKTECIRSVGNIELQSPVEPIQEVSKLWLTSISVKQGSLPFCQATVKHRQCASIQDRYSNQDPIPRDPSNWVYHGILSRKLSVHETKQPMIQWLLQRSHASLAQQEELIFNTQVDCIPQDSELYPDGSDWALSP